MDPTQKASPIRASSDANNEGDILGKQAYISIISSNTLISYQVDAYLDGPGGKLDPNGGLGLQVELIPCEPGQQIGLANSGVTNQNHCCKRYRQKRLACTSCG